MTFTETLQAVLSFIIQVFVIFPYSALTIQRQRQLPQPARLAAIVARDDLPTSPGKAKGLKETNLAMLSEAVYNVCRNPESVSTVLGKDPTIAPADAWKKLYGGHAAGERGGDSKAINKAGHYEYTAEDLKRAEECGNWGPIKPSDLFLKVCGIPSRFCYHIGSDRYQEITSQYAYCVRCITMPSALWTRASQVRWSVHP
jgi:hypothetical protein